LPVLAGRQSAPRQFAICEPNSIFEAGGLNIVCDYADVPVDRVISWARRRYSFAA
jgi:hypothetical protein